MCIFSYDLTHSHAHVLGCGYQLVHDLATYVSLRIMEKKHEGT